VTLPPGPRGGRAAMTAAWVARPGPFLLRARARYGDAFTIRIGHEAPWVVLSDPDAIREVFTGNPEVFHAGEGNEVLLPILGSRSVLLLDEAPHLQARKRLLPPFHGERLKAWAQTMAEVAEREVATWPRGEPLAVLPRMQEVTLEIILRTVFGSTDARLRDALRRMLDRTTGPEGMALMMLLGPERLARTRVFRREMDPVDAVLAEHVRALRGRDDLGERGDVASMLVAAGMGDEELRDELMTLLVAGHETTATGLAWATERLARRPEALERLRDGDDEWADAVVKETLRLRPVLPVVVRRLARAAEVGGMTLPAGVAVAPCIYLVHRREDVYPEPHAFRPERFLGVKPGTYTWLPFGGGVRRCIGAAFAELEMRAVLGVLARAADLQPARPEPERIRRRAITLTPDRGGEVLLAGARARRSAASSAARPPAPAAAPGPSG